MKLLLVALLALTTTTLHQERENRVSNVAPAALFPYYNGPVTVNHSPTVPTVRISAFSGDCGLRYLSEVQRVNHAMVALGVTPASIEIDETDPGKGVDTCLGVDATCDGRAISIARSGGGSLLSIHHYSVFTSIDGFNLKLLIDLAPSANGLDLTQFAIKPGTFFYLKVVGQPLMRNTFIPMGVCPQ